MSAKWPFLFGGVLLTLGAPRAHCQCPPTFFKNGSQANSGIGGSVAMVGDVNDDGFDDVIVGEPGYDEPLGLNCGRARVFSGKNGATIWSWSGDSESASFGNWVDGAGDMNKDGTPDVIVGSYWRTGVNGPRSGKVYVNSGVSGQTIWTWEGEHQDSRFGQCVANAGDVDGDGLDDVLVGAPGPDDGRLFGRAYVFSGATGRVVWAWDGDAPGDWFGYRLDGAGDVNRDGFADVIVSGGNKVRVMSGKTGVQMFLFQGADWESFGSAVSGVGDIDDDGFDDFVIGAMYHSSESQIECGQVSVFSGSTGSIVWTVEGTTDLEFFGHAAAGVNDTNLDSRPDIVVGANSYCGELGCGAGRAVILSGADGSLLQSWEGEAAADFFGYSVGGGGDCNGDGRSDIIVGAPYHTGQLPAQGRAYVFCGRPLADLTCDFHVDVDDLLGVLNSWGFEGTTTADFNQDKVVDVDDLALVIDNWTD